MDFVNGLFEFVGAVLICLSIRQLHRDKVVRGVSLVPIAFFTSWGWWNLLFYPALGQWCSFVGGLFMVTANGAWLVQMVFYKVKERYAPHGDLEDYIHNITPTETPFASLLKRDAEHPSAVLGDHEEPWRAPSSAIGWWNDTNAVAPPRRARA